MGCWSTMLGCCAVIPDSLRLGAAFSLWPFAMAIDDRPGRSFLTSVGLTLCPAVSQFTGLTLAHGWLQMDKFAIFIEAFQGSHGVPTQLWVKIFKAFTSSAATSTLGTKLAIARAAFGVKFRTCHVIDYFVAVHQLPECIVLIRYTNMYIYTSCSQVQLLNLLDFLLIKSTFKIKLLEIFPRIIWKSDVIFSPTPPPSVILRHLWTPPYSIFQ